MEFRALKSLAIPFNVQILMGLLHYPRRLSHGVTHGIPNLTAVNPYIASSLHPAKYSFGADSGVLMPRQQGCSIGAAAEAGSGFVGISGFAFQGTNAHVITGR